MHAAPRKSAPEPVSVNRQARRDYHVIEVLEAGIELQGSEVKSVRAGNISLAGGFAAVGGGELFLQGVRIAPYEQANRFNHDPDRPKRLLLHRRQIDRAAGQIAQRGYTLVPLRAYFRRGRVKIELALCRGKQAPDKRREIRRRTADREARAALGRTKRDQTRNRSQR